MTCDIVGSKQFATRPKGEKYIVATSRRVS